jgi:hypothetical protein
VSPDGKTMTTDFLETAQNPGGAPVAASQTYARLGAPPAGAHAISGTWRKQAITSLSASAGVVVFQVVGNTIHESSPIGDSYTAAFDGKPYPVTGNPGETSVTLRRLGPHSFVETDWRDGKKVDITTWSVSPGGKSLTVVDNYLESGVTMTYQATKQ